VVAERIRVSAKEQGAPRIVVLIDGHSGSGKTTLATELAYALKAEHVSLDSFYPGWGGLEVGSAMVRGVLGTDNPGYRRWDWKRSQPAEFHKVNPRRDIVVEGSGCLSRANRELATFAIWIRLDQVERKRRAIARDGATYHEHWDRWAAQEQGFFARERPDTLADALMDGRTGQVAFRADLLTAPPPSADRRVDLAAPPV
jgi:gluconate kinase